MNCKKDGRYLVFTKEDGALAKFDLGNNICYRFYNGKIRPVKQLNNFFKGIDVGEIIDSFMKGNEAYGRFIKSIAFRECQCSNMGTFLNRLHKYAHLENWHLLGIEVDSFIKSKTSDYPKDILRIFQNHDITFTASFERTAKEHRDIIFNSARYIEDKYGKYEDDFNFVFDNIRCYGLYSLEDFISLIIEFNYNYRRLIDYAFWHMPRYEDINSIRATQLLHDYVKSKTLMGVRFDKYPKFLKSVHDITALGFRKFKIEYSKEIFEKCVDKQYNWRYNGYIIRCAESADEVKDEGAQLSHCVASYVEDIIMGKSLILFMRKEKEPEKSVLTIEIRNRVVKQVRGLINASPTKEQSKIICKWAKEKDLKLSELLEVY